MKIIILSFLLCVSFWKNTDAQWIQVNNGMGNVTVNSLIHCGNNIFAGTFYASPFYGVYLSSDNGSSWTQTSLNNQNISSLAANGNKIFAGSSSPNNGIF